MNEPPVLTAELPAHYETIFADVSGIIDTARKWSVLIQRLATDLTQRFGKGFSRQNIQQMRLFCLSYPIVGFAEQSLAYPISIPLKHFLGTFTRSFFPLVLLATFSQESQGLN